jgi:hypothetical protein
VEISSRALVCTTLGKFFSMMRNRRTNSPIKSQIRRSLHTLSFPVCILILQHDSDKEGHWFSKEGLEDPETKDMRTEIEER